MFGPGVVPLDPRWKSRRDHGSTNSESYPKIWYYNLVTSPRNAAL